jgi:uncharacterized protein (DUF697 family)
MPAGIGTGQLWGLVRETRDLERGAGALAISGPGAWELAARLSDGGDPAAVFVGANPESALAAIVLLDGVPGTAELDTMRRAARAGVPLLAVRGSGHGGRLPYVLAEDVIDVAEGTVPVERIAAAVASALGDEAAPLAARLPVLRDAVQRRVIGRAAVTNAVIAAAPWITQAQMPLLTLTEGRMLLRLGVARGGALPRDPRELALAAGAPLAGSLGAGLALRELYRRLRWRGRLAGAAVAYTGTRALGELRTRV